MKLESSYDPKMEDLPLFIAFARSGNHWINAVMEVYFNRPRLRQSEHSIFKDRNDYMWFGDHDETCDVLDKIFHNNILYMHRNPEDILFSYSYAFNKGIDWEFINEKIPILKNHYEKYLLSNKVKTIIRYENLEKDFNNEFIKIVNFFGFDSVNTTKLNQAQTLITKQFMIERAKNDMFMGQDLASEKYQIMKNNFCKNYKDQIRERVIISPSIQSFFQD